MSGAQRPKLLLCIESFAEPTPLALSPPHLKTARPGPRLPPATFTCLCAAPLPAVDLSCARCCSEASHECAAARDTDAAPISPPPPRSLPQPASRCRGCCCCCCVQPRPRCLSPLRPQRTRSSTAARRAHAHAHAHACADRPSRIKIESQPALPAVLAHNCNCACPVVALSALLAHASANAAAAAAVRRSCYTRAWDCSTLCHRVPWRRARRRRFRLHLRSTHLPHARPAVCVSAPSPRLLRPHPSGELPSERARCRQSCHWPCCASLCHRFLLHAVNQAVFTTLNTTCARLTLVASPLARPQFSCLPLRDTHPDAGDQCWLVAAA